MSLKELVDDLNYEVFEETDAVELAQFTYQYDGKEHIDFNGFPVYSDNESDRGWNYHQDDYDRTEREQVILEMTELRDNLTKILTIIGETNDK